jgi:hypothetical protein
MLFPPDAGGNSNLPHRGKERQVTAKAAATATLAALLTLCVLTVSTVRSRYASSSNRCMSSAFIAACPTKQLFMNT